MFQLRVFMISPSREFALDIFTQVIQSLLPTSTTTRRLSPTTFRPISRVPNQFAYLSPCFEILNNLVALCKIISIELISPYLIIIRPSLLLSVLLASFLQVHGPWPFANCSINPQYYITSSTSQIERQSESLLLPPSLKECNYEKRAGQINLTVTKFTVNNISIYVSN